MKNIKALTKNGNTLFTMRETEKSTFINISKEASIVFDMTQLADIQQLFGAVHTIEELVEQTTTSFDKKSF